MIELMLGALVVSGMLCVVPQAVADMVATVRASAAGQWDLIDRQRGRRQERWAKAWGAVRAARNRRAGGDGSYRPGASAYLGDLYHGFWEDRLEKRGAKRAARPPYEYNPGAPKWHERFDAAVLDKVDRLRDASGRAGRALVNPVGEGRQAADVPRTFRPEDGDVVDAARPTEELCELCRREPAVTVIPPIGLEDPLRACPTCHAGVLDARRAQEAKQRVAREVPQGPVSGVVHDSDEYVTRPAQGATAEEINANITKLAPNCPDCGHLMTSPPYEGPDVTDGGDLRLDPYACPNCGRTVTTYINHGVGTIRVAKSRDTLTNSDDQQSASRAGTNSTSQGDATMNDTAVDVLKYNQAVADHEQALASLRIQLDQAAALASHLGAAVGAVEGMDNARDQVATATTALAEGLEQGRYGATSLEGAATSAEILTAGQVSTTQEAIEAAQTQNQEWIAGLEVAIAGVEASLSEIQAQFGEAAAVVQETGVDGRALEAE